jgi:hypothetical protein
MATVCSGARVWLTVPRVQRARVRRLPLCGFPEAVLSCLAGAPYASVMTISDIISIRNIGATVLEPDRRGLC